MADPVALGQTLRGMSGSGQHAWFNPSQAINTGFSAGSFLPMVGPAASLGSALYGFYNGANGLTSQTPSGVGGMIDPRNPGLLQQAGNWLGSQFAHNPQLPLSAGSGPNMQSSGSDMSGRPLTGGGQFAGGSIGAGNPGGYYGSQGSMPSSAVGGTMGGSSGGGILNWLFGPETQAGKQQSG